MKIRSDFVTNSSSSSFVLQFKNKTELKSFLQEIRERAGNFAADTLEVDIERNRVGKREALFNIRNDISNYRLLRKMNIPYTAYSFAELNNPNTEIGRKILELKNAEVAEISKRLDSKCIITHIEVADDYQELSLLEHEILPRHKNTVFYASHH